MATPELFDFIVVGGGTSGCVIASRLANSPAAPTVLLLEAGGDNSAEELRSIDLRYDAARSPGLDWGYKSLPVVAQDGVVQTYLRGKGLGGSSATNFCYWTLGEKEDFNLWAEKVGDDAWKWEGDRGVKARFRKVERLHVAEGLPKHKELWDSNVLKEHSREGMLDVTYFSVPENDSLEELGFHAAKEIGLPYNGDINSGDSIGFGVTPSTVTATLRHTAASAYLDSKPESLTVITGSLVSKILLEGKKVVGIESIDGTIFRASKDVIISAGSIDTPKLLLLSGIGPSQELSKLSIPTIHNLPGVGKNLMDHTCLLMPVLLKPNAAYNKAKARNHQTVLGWFHDEKITSSEEFRALTPVVQESLARLPTHEMFLSNFPFNIGEYVPLPDDRFITFVLGLMNPQSRGSVTLSSADPRSAPHIELNYLGHAYDRRIAIEGYRELYKYLSAPTFATRTQAVLNEPPTQTATDDEIFAYWRKAGHPIWHACGSCKMGKIDDPTTVVGTDFRVVGIRGLRIVDMSVAPVIPNNHTQSTAYLIGETAAEKMIDEYRLAQ